MKDTRSESSFLNLHLEITNYQFAIAFPHWTEARPSLESSERTGGRVSVSAPVRSEDFTHPTCCAASSLTLRVGVGVFEVVLTGLGDRHKFPPSPVPDFCLWVHPTRRSVLREGSRERTAFRLLLSQLDADRARPCRERSRWSCLRCTL